MLILCLITLGSPGWVRAHGVELIKEHGSGIQVRAMYSDGEPVNYAEVMIYAPDDPGRAFQRGRTDRSGRFAFCPDAKGSWRVVISDGMGHQLDQKIEVGRAAKAATGQAPRTAGLPMAYKVLMGLSLIFGLFGLAAMVAAHRKTSKRDAGPAREEKV